ncbi:MAG: glutamate-5-semialdehyde dehydrogenase [Lachnospiraceae bacterium]|nr:glutamate-5-semialdehyde dehydrogenase [Lachnospiraceae bacterium]
MSEIKAKIHEMKLDAPKMMTTSAKIRNKALLAIRDALLAGKEQIFAENEKDLSAAEENGIADAVKKRLRFHEGKLSDVVKGLEGLAELPDPVGRVTLHRQLDEGLILKRITCPIGVIGVIFEARPDALVQISALCIKSGNCAVLKGGKETTHTNRILFRLIRDAAVGAGLPENCLMQAEQHSEIDELLECDTEVDLLIPRGSNTFVRYIMDHTRIPVMGHADGVCHIYVGKTADQENAIRILLDAKTQYTAACNAVESILVHREIAKEFLPKLEGACKAQGIKLRGTKEVCQVISGESMDDAEFSTEYLSLTASVKLVSGVEEAVDHINRYGSHHTDAILTEDDEEAAYFMQMVDSAGVYRNCSTRFSDGYRYGFGAEVGISTGKLHARGPVGLDGLMTYKYELTGSGQIVGDYAEGKSSFHFRDLE